RPKQVIQIKATPDQKDIVTKIEYDGFGRQVLDYLPVPTSQATGAYIDPTNITGAYYQTEYSEDTWYSEKTIENSPLNRVMAQAAPGDDWAKGAGHEIEFEYQTNDTKEDRINWMDNGTIMKGGYNGKSRSEERRVGKEGRYRWETEQEEKTGATKGMNRRREH